MCLSSLHFYRPLHSSLPFFSFFFLMSIFLVLADSPHTIGVEFGTRIISIQNHKIKLQVRSLHASFALLSSLKSL